MFKHTESDFNIDKHLISFLQDSPFFAELSRHIHKSPTRDIPTAGVAYDEKSDELMLFWNPDFFAGLSACEIRGVLTHEYYHIVFGHIYSRRRKPHALWNVSTDLAINSIISLAGKTGAKLDGKGPLPDGCLLPGVWPKKSDGREMTAEEKAAAPLAAIIAGLPTMQSSEWYFDKIKQEADEKGLGTEDGDFGCCASTLDDHEIWDSMSDEMREYVENRVKSIVEKAVNHADGQANGWGSIPSELISAIRKSVSSVINWRSVLRQFVGQICRGNRSTSIKRINRRYPYIHPGVKRGYVAKLLIAIDQSGSVSNELLCEFFAELGSLTKNVTIDVLPFDCDANEKDIFTWKKGTNIDPKRVRGGGTDFNAPTKIANDAKNRGRWDGVLCLTDGEAPKPCSSRIKRGWVIGSGRKLNFNTDEIVVCMDNGKTATGSWR